MALKGAVAVIWLSFTHNVSFQSQLR